MTPFNYMNTFGIGTAGCDVIYDQMERRVDMQTLRRWFQPARRDL